MSNVQTMTDAEYDALDRLTHVADVTATDIKAILDHSRVVGDRAMARIAGEALAGYLYQVRRVVRVIRALRAANAERDSEIA